MSALYHTPISPCGICAKSLTENIALRCMLGAGCDANNDGSHTIAQSVSGEFCAACGEMTHGGKSKPWFNEDRLERAVARLGGSAFGMAAHALEEAKRRIQFPSLSNARKDRRTIEEIDRVLAAFNLETRNG